jgi:predicted permease
MRKTPWPVRLFSAVANSVLPRGFRREFGADQRDAIADQYRNLQGRGLGPAVRFWLHETAGLLATATREYGELLQRRRRTPDRRRPDFDSPKRKPEMLNTFRKDLLYAFRMTVKTPVVTVIAIVSIALGVAANTTIFSVLNSWLLRPLPYPHADRMLVLYENNRNDPDDRELVSPANFFDWQERTSSFAVWVASSFSSRSLTGIERPQQMTVALVTPNLFAELGSDPMRGRTFAADEGGPEDAPVAVLSETTWRNQFGADPDIVGSTIMLNGEAHAVIGVMPETFDYILGTVNLWIPSTFEDQRDNRDSRYLNVTAWRGTDVPFERAQAELVALASRLEEEYPTANENWGVNVQTVREQFPGRTDTGLILVLGVVVGMALLIACANVASLLLAKTEARQKELAVRVALGAGRGRLVQQLLTESVVLALIAGGLGTVLSIWGVGGLREAIPVQIPGFFQPRLDGAVIAFSLGLSVLAGLTFGITPATQVLSSDLRGALTDGTRSGSASKRKKRLRSAFVMAEFAMALTILIAAAVLTNLVNTTIDVDPGYDSANLLTMQFTLPQYKYERAEEIAQFVDNLDRELDQLPGSRGRAFTNRLPRAFGLPQSVFTIDGQPTERSEEPRAGWLSVISAHWISPSGRAAT